MIINFPPFVYNKYSECQSESTPGGVSRSKFVGAIGPRWKNTNKNKQKAQPPVPPARIWKQSW